MLGWDAIALARKYPGLKIRRETWDLGVFIHFNESQNLVIDNQDEHQSVFVGLENENWEIHECSHKEEWLDTSVYFSSTYCNACQEKIKPDAKEPKMITWYRPKFYCDKDDDRIKIPYAFYKSKQRFFDALYDQKFVKVVNDEWETIEAPENWEDM